MLVINGCIGHAPGDRVPIRLCVDAANANVAGMQR